jgi:haloalkane dehalogenase
VLGSLVPVAGTTMHYVAVGAGRPVVFLHGNPTSSYLWRRVLPPMLGAGRLIAPGLVGMGRSGKPDIGYRLTDHIAHVTAFIDALGISEFAFVAHDWGVAIALDYLRAHPDRVTGVAFMEGHLRPLGSIDATFRALRTPGVGERMALDENFFVEKLLPAAVPDLSPTDLDEYRRPYRDAPSRRPLLQWAREIPIAGEPADNVRLFEAAWDNFCRSPVPKLLIHGDPGVVVTPETVAMCRDALPALSVAGVGAAGHFLPEEAPSAVASALLRFLRT